MSTNMFIKDRQSFEELWRRVNEVFHPGKRLPDQVFSTPYTGFLVDEFVGCTMTPDFWRSIQTGLLSAETNKISIAVLDPDPVEYFYREFSCFNAFEFSINLSPDKYSNALQTGPDISPADAALYNSTTIVVIPDSMNWAIWGDRDLEICIIGFNKEKGADKIPFTSNWWPIDNHWMTVEKALDTIMPPVFCHQGGKVPDDLAKTLIQNYGGGANAK